MAPSRATDVDQHTGQAGFGDCIVILAAECMSAANVSAPNSVTSSQYAALGGAAW